MDIKKLSNDVSVSPEIVLSDLQAIKDLAYKTIVCNRPDNETSEQVNFDLIESAARELGIEAFHQPVISGKINKEDVAKFKKLMGEVKLPMLAYCRSGTRCAMLWSMAMSGELSNTEILQKTKAAGYDVSALLR
jgi:sulfide:quinone oxidoreductase